MECNGIAWEAFAEGCRDVKGSNAGKVMRETDSLQRRWKAGWRKRGKNLSSNR